ncbi:MAG: hypothetical protein LAO03_19890 [Acidobacteriia bacterium]|nr:hypothetical protein [Terriglobia bacterium]
MTIQLKSVFLSAALAALILPAAAQSTDSATTPAQPAPTTTKEQNVQHRAHAQQTRIANGIKTGELTSGEAASLEKQESKLNKEATAMKAEDNGKLTAADRAKLEQQQNKLSKEIYQQKHDAQTQNTNPTTEVGKRAENEQDRIANGVASGQLTAGEAARLENQQKNLHNEVAADRAANGGKLTPAERAKVNRQQNRTSRNIYHQKHDAQHR